MGETSTVVPRSIVGQDALVALPRFPVAALLKCDVRQQGSAFGGRQQRRYDFEAASRVAEPVKLEASLAFRK